VHAHAKKRSTSDETVQLTNKNQDSLDLNGTQTVVNFPVMKDKQAQWVVVLAAQGSLRLCSAS
jgi:hypothetical protein